MTPVFNFTPVSILPDCSPQVARQIRYLAILVPPSSVKPHVRAIVSSQRRGHVLLTAMQTPCQPAFHLPSGSTF